MEVSKMKRGLGVVLVFAASLGAIGCSHHQAPASQPVQPKPIAKAPPPPPPKPKPAPPPPPPPPPPPMQSAQVYFDYDQSVLTTSATSILQGVWSDWQKHATDTVKISGNCDERGTEEYNMALGQARADAAKKYLTQLGAKDGAITTISYGKDKPISTGHDESSWSQNRRDDLTPSGK
jgi:peptidoglycan-associated lipoprotein